ncbi:hypothetical protein [Serratia marcescens]|uniref:hypothetical protein n=1 Tax=Serratia TaxID=613 RepID=UPI00301BF07F
MDNKLSELSKPVAYDYQIAGACIADGHNENGKWVDWNNKLSRYCPPDWMVEEGKVTELKPLYSQEYVSALLAELEAKDKRIAELEAVTADASQVFKEIGIELGCNPDNESIMLAIDDLKATQMTGTLAMIIKRAEEMERILEGVTPEMIAGGWTAKGISDYAKSLEAKLATPVRLPNKNDDEFWFDGVFQVAKFDRAVERAIRAAGFIIEGDE